MNKAGKAGWKNAASLQRTGRKPAQKLPLFRSWASPFALFSLTVLHLQGFFSIDYLGNRFSQLSSVWTMTGREGTELPTLWDMSFSQLKQQIEKYFGQYLKWERMFTKCHSILRILAVLGLFVSFKVVKDGRWQEKTVTNRVMVSAASKWFSCQGPTLLHRPKTSSNTQLFSSSFSRCAQGSSSPDSLCHGYWFLNLTFKNACCGSQATEEQHHASLLTLHKSCLLLHTEHWVDPGSQK